MAALTEAELDAKWPHGTYARYHSGKCRCDKCKAANNAQYKLWKAQRIARTPFDEIPHGANGYDNYDCRCETCCDGKSTDNRHLMANWLKKRRYEGIMRPKARGVRFDLVYPQRQRCAKCRRFFGLLVIKGLYDSYECAGMVPGPVAVDDPSGDVLSAPRKCRVMVGGDWRFKRRYPSLYEALQAANDGRMEAYGCDYCGTWHVGHRR